DLGHLRRVGDQLGLLRRGDHAVHGLREAAVGRDQIGHRWWFLSLGESGARQGMKIGAAAQPAAGDVSGRPVRGPWRCTARLNTVHATTTMSDPGTSMSRSRRYPEEYAIALPGVPTGRVKASPDGNATTGAMTRGSMPYCVAIPRATGMSRATTAE